MFQSGQEALPLKVADEAKEDGKGVEELRLHQARGTQFERRLAVPLRVARARF